MKYGDRYDKLNDELLFGKRLEDMNEDERALFEFKAKENADDIRNRLRHTPQMRDAVILQLAKDMLEKQEKEQVTND